MGEPFPEVIVLLAALARPDDDAGERDANRDAFLTIVLAGDCDLIPRGIV